MGYNGHERAKQHIREYHGLERQLGPILPEIKEKFFSLNIDDLSSLLARYGQLHSEKARQYACNTFAQWKDGSRKMSGQTAKRLIDLVPQYISFDEKFKLIDTLCKHYTEKEIFHVVVNMDSAYEGVAEIKRILSAIEDKPLIKFLPNEVYELMSWLSDNDSKIAQMILSKIDEQTHNEVTRIAKQEMAHLLSVAGGEAVSNATQEIDLPLAKIFIDFRKPQKSLFSRIINFLR